MSSVAAAASGTPLRSLATYSSLPTTLTQVRQTLQDAINRGRIAPFSQNQKPTITVRQSPPSSLAQRPLPHCLQGLHVEHLEYKSDDSSQGYVPLRLAKLPHEKQPSNVKISKLPTVILLHPTGADFNWCAEEQAAAARRGYLAAAIDCRYHGARVDSSLTYQQSLVEAYLGNTPEHPFLLDNIWDLQRLLDYLESRDDVDKDKIGVTGFSLGGMHAWLLAAVDQRIAAAAPAAGVQHFQWAIDQGKFMARVESIPLVFAAAAQHIKGSAKSRVDKEVVEAVWRRILPGLLSENRSNGGGDGDSSNSSTAANYDAPNSLSLIAPRPLLIAQGAVDPRCPIEGVELAVKVAKERYSALGVSDRLLWFAQPGVGHEPTEKMNREIWKFLDAYLLP